MSTKKQTFKAWMSEVDKELVGRCGFDHQCLGDQLWRDWFNDGYEPSEAAEECLENEGFPG